MMSMHFENLSSLPTVKTGFHSDKLDRIHHLCTKLNVELISLVETQSNPSLISSKDSLHTIMLKNKPYASILSNNQNELIGKR